MATYRANLAIVSLSLSLPLGLVGFLAYNSISHGVPLDKPQLAAFALFLSPFLLWVVYLLALRVEVTFDSIEYRNLLRGISRIPFREISSCVRETKEQYEEVTTSTLYVTPNPSTGIQPMKIPLRLFSLRAHLELPALLRAKALSKEDLTTLF